METTNLKPFRGEDDPENKFCLHRAILLFKGYSANSSIDANKSRLKRIRSNIFVLQRLKEKFPEPDIEKLAQYAKLNFKFYTKKGKYELIAESDTAFDRSINFQCVNNPLNSSKIVFTFEILSVRQKAKLERKTLKQVLQENGVNYKHPFFLIQDENDFRKEHFGISFYSNPDEFIDSKLIYKSYDQKLSLIISQNSADLKKIPINEEVMVISDNYLAVHFCENIGCGYSNKNKGQVTRHMKTCSDKTKYTYKETQYPQQDSTRKELAEIGINESYRFLCWDIEALNSGDTFNFGSSKCLGRQKVVSIALYGEGINKVFLNDEGNAVEKFLEYVEDIQDKFFQETPDNVKSYIENLQIKLQIKNLLPSLKTRYQRHLKYLKNMSNLFLVGYNSGGYDLPAIITEILEVVDPSDISVIKQGSCIFSMTYNNIKFVDAMKFTSGGSLAKFCATFGSPTSKGLFPYEYFEDISELKNCREWPPMKAFKSSLGNDKFEKSEISEVRAYFSSDQEFNDFFGIQSVEEFCVSPKQYFDAKVEFNFNIFSSKYNSFLDHLVHYNIKDVKMLYEAFSNYIELFRSTFGCQVLTRVSLPGLAEGMSAVLYKARAEYRRRALSNYLEIMWSKFDDKWGKVFTFGENFGDLNDKLRSALLGGPTIIYNR